MSTKNKTVLVNYLIVCVVFRVGAAKPDNKPARRMLDTYKLFTKSAVTPDNILQSSTVTLQENLKRSFFDS